MSGGGGGGSMGPTAQPYSGYNTPSNAFGGSPGGAQRDLSMTGNSRPGGGYMDPRFGMGGPGGGYQNDMMQVGGPPQPMGGRPMVEQGKFTNPTQSNSHAGLFGKGGMGAEDTSDLYPPTLPPTPAPGASAPGTGGVDPNPATGALPPPGNGGQSSGPNNMFWQMRQWNGVPYNQTYGGQPAPFDNLHSQIRNTLNMGDAGAGRFTGNAAARYGFQGGNQGWRPDANPWNQPIQPYGYQPRNVFQRTGGLPGQQPQQPQQPQQGVPQQPATPPGYGQPVDHAANFRQLQAQDPRLAYEYTQRNGDTINWWQQNKNGLFNNDVNQLNEFSRANSNVSSNSAPLSMDEMRRLNTMAGIRSPF